MNKINCKKEIHVVFGILSIFGAILISTTGVLNSVYGQGDYSSNQTNTPAAATTNASNATTAKQEASNSIKGVINEAGQFLSNAAQKLTTSKSAGALLNDTSDALGNAYVETKKFFSPN
jgi:ABC-type protease/lipase transport system fused ATPase/permease subunit